jgi:ribosomal protein L4
MATKKAATKKVAKKAGENVSAPFYALTGKSAGNVELSGSVFNRAWNGDLVHHVVIGMQANGRTGLAHTKGSIRSFRRW